MATAIKEDERIQVGYIIAKAKIIPDVLRCHRYRRFGHTSYHCKAHTERHEIFRCCKEKGHGAVTCMVPKKCSV